MKRLFALIISLSVLLSCISSASAANAGSQADPLVTESYFLDTFMKPLMEKGSAKVISALNDAYDFYEGAADELHDIFMLRTGGSGFRFTGGQEQITVNSGESISLGSGSKITVISGSVKMEINSGEVINISSGSKASSGTLGKAKTYFTTEKTVAVFTASEQSTVIVDGFVKAGVAVSTLPFKDVPSNAWYYGAVSFVYNRGLFSGTSATTFEPDTSMTRAMFVQVLWTLAGKPSPKSASAFPDVSNPKSWYYNAVCWASENGIVVGANGYFLPDKSITRQEMAIIMCKYASFRGISVSVSDSSAFYSFSDCGDVASWAKDSVMWATYKGIINGSNGKLLPLDTASRSQVAQVIKNYCSVIG